MLKRREVLPQSYAENFAIVYNLDQRLHDKILGI